ncbi:MAG: thermosome subunit alpha [Candidatus Helarchaeota archaeon]
MAELSGQPVLILKEGSSRSRGRDAQHNNIMAAKVIAEAIRTSLGPKGMDKMLVDSFGDVTITNDGATILKEMDLQHPTAKMVVEVAKTQDQEVGDGTTTAAILTGELLKNAEELINENIHPTIIVDGYRKAVEKALEIVDNISIDISNNESMLYTAAKVAMGSKIIAEVRDLFADYAVKAIKAVQEGNNADLDNISVLKKKGEGLEDTIFVNGIVIDKEIVHAGMPKRVENAKIALVESAFEITKTEFDSKISITQVDQMQAFLDQEEKTIREMVEKVAEAGANVVLCQKGIDDLAQHFMNKKGIAAVRRIKKSDMEKLAKATGAKIVTNIHTITADDLGYAGLVEERKIGDDDYVFIENCKNPKAVSVMIRGGTNQLVDEAERAFHDALCVVRNLIRVPKVVYGGGAAEIEIARGLRQYADSLSGREQLAVSAFADAIEVIPRTLAENAGLDIIDILAELRAKHDSGEISAGVDVMNGKVGDMKEINVYDPAIVKKQALESATEAAIMILRIDDVIAAGKSSGGGPPGGGPEGGESDED